MDDYITSAVFKEYSNRMDDAHEAIENRLSKLEATMEKIQSLTIAVEKMAMSIETMTDEIKKQGTKIEAMEAKPAENWQKLLWLVGTAVVGAVIGYVLKGIGI